MGIALIRVDERLLHGQVTVGWGSRLQPDRYILVDDDLAGDDWEQGLYRLAAPTDVDCDFVRVDEARERIPEWSADSASTILLTRDLEHVVRIARGGVLSGHDVNLGGIHARDGRTEVAAYLFLDEEDRDRVRELERAGVTAWGQDLPGSPRISGMLLTE